MRSLRRQLALSAAGAALITSVALLSPAQASAAESGPVTISGKVGCLNNLSPDGIWVEATNGGSGFAQWTIKPEEGREGFGYAYYTFTLPRGGSYHLNVGCDGTAKHWGMTAQTPTVSGASYTFKCNDISPALESLGEWAFSRSLGRWIKALDFTEGIEYGRCASV
jgi:hypothetical protein